MPKFTVGETVFGSALGVDKGAKLDHALVEGKVVALRGRSVEVDFRNNVGLKTVATARLHKNVSFLLIEIGDFSNETANLDPLAASVHGFLRLLISDDALVKFVKLRSVDELAYVLKTYGTYSHILLVGHGASGVLCVGNSGQIPATTVSSLIDQHCTSRPTFLSMCCHSGEAAFAKPVSGSAACGAFVGPKGAIHSCSASHFVQSFLGFQILEGLRLKSAFDRAKECTPGAACLRLWKAGTIQ